MSPASSLGNQPVGLSVSKLASQSVCLYICPSVMHNQTVTWESLFCPMFLSVRPSVCLLVCPPVALSTYLLVSHTYCVGLLNQAMHTFLRTLLFSNLVRVQTIYLMFPFICTLTTLKAKLFL